MNFLAHLYLSPENDQIRLGCFIADAVKGSQFNQYPPLVQEGILLHRRQDAFTDQHEAIKEGIVHLRPAFRHYSGVVFDIYCDHFLASNWSHYSNGKLSVFAKQQYQLVEDNFFLLPEKMKNTFYYMQKNNWLENYKHLYFLRIVFMGMSERTVYQSNMSNGVHELQKHYAYFEKQFHVFFQECISSFLPEK